jgi:tetratricopeptide (TPR) repeat protein
MRSMMRLCGGLLLIWLFALPASAQFNAVGSLQFPTSTPSAEAQNHFLRGVAILHSFGWKQAIEEFQSAQKLDPDFALAYWGETLCYNHPLFGGPSPDEDNPRAVLARLGPTREARLSKAPTDRERGFLNAVETLWDIEGTYDERRVAYMDAMAELHERYPDDHEVGTFYAVATLSAARALGDQTGRLEMRAGTIALSVFNANSNHPGAPHYAIHSFDDPIHAPLALPSALKFAEIAPAVAHALHMPTHIFIQHGMWDLVSSHNQRAYDAARRLWEAGDSVGDTVHPLDWGQYGDLQLGNYAKARTWIERIEMVADESDGQTRAVDAISLLKARYVVETEEWTVQPVTEESSVPELLATGLSAVRLGDLGTARKAEAELAKRASDGSAQDKITYKEVAAVIHAAEGEGDAATALMDEALEIVMDQRLPNGAASPIKPPFELYGELLLSLDRPEDASEKFDMSLMRMPKRARSLLGAARAAAAHGDDAMAREHYATLLSFWKGPADHPGAEEARRFTTQDQNQ